MPRVTCKRVCGEALKGLLAVAQSQAGSLTGSAHAQKLIARREKVPGVRRKRARVQGGIGFVEGRCD